MTKFAIVSLGCSRNLVDSEVIAGELKKDRLVLTDIEKNPEIVIVNTCAFIESARKESVEAILEAARLKKEGKIKLIVVAGCLAQLHGKDVASELPEADLFVGTSDIPGISDTIRRAGAKGIRMSVSKDLRYIYNEDSPRYRFTPRHWAYVKVSEGCSNFCSYCIISRLRGQFRSRPMPSVIEEVKKISSDGYLREIELIGQDTTAFGIDRYGKMMFPELLRRLARLKNGIEWIRILYTHPRHYTDELIETIRNEHKICKYLDLPIQHISDRVLKRMNRKTSRKDIIDLIERLRSRIPGLVLRTSIIVGFPGETEKDFKDLLKFVRETEFERLGAFIYSAEEGTAALRLGGQVHEKVRTARFDELMKLQKRISSGLNKRVVGQTVKVLIDEKVKGEKDEFMGRTEGDAPEVDGTVYVSGKGLKVGQFYDVSITGSTEYDLIGQV
jgi:ribosomal protein S12 methylthiotransferase